MSYDLAIYTRQSSTPELVAAMVNEVAGLEADRSGDGSMTVLRGARRRYSFTIDGPDDLEPEDVPAEVTQIVLGPRHLWSILVEGSATSEVPHATRFARRLAQALDGAVVDQQTDEVWSRSKSRTIQKPTREERVSEVRIDWYCLREAVTDDVIQLYLEAATRFVPEVLPRRFGEYEPLQGKYAEVGSGGFEVAWRDATSLLFVAGSGPVIGGNLHAGPSERHPSKFWMMSFSFHASALREPAWRDAVRGLFAALADNLPAFYASAQLTRGHIWSGRSSWSDGDTEWALNPLRYRVGWTGLPPIPMWWHWLGSPYSEHASALPQGRITPTAAGVLFEASPQPLPRDELPPLTSWLPEDLFAVLAPNPSGSIPAPLVTAKRIPDMLR